MITKLVNVDGHFFLEVDAGILRRAGIDPEQPVEVSADQARRVILTQPEDPEGRARFLRAMEEVGRRHADLFRRLAQY
jgi:hypothetical protein